MHATLTILRHADEYHFLWTTTHTSPGLASGARGASRSPICLSGTTAIDSQQVQMLQRHINAAADALNLAQAGADSVLQAAGAPAAHSFETLGRLLFSQLIPTAIQQQIHALPAGSTLQIITTGLNHGIDLPWELLHDGRNLLALQHSLSRLPMLAQPQYQYQPRQHAPKVSCLLLGNPNRDLPAAEKEISAIEEILYAARDRVRYRSLYGDQITRIHVQELLASQQYDLIHFAGHARPGALRLADGWFSAEEIVAALHNHPLVILNACASAQSAPETTDLASMAQKAESLASAFIQGGAAAVIGMLWPVPDTMMVQLGEELYRHLIAGQGIGEALRLSRVAIQPRDRGGMAWLAPVLYGNPDHQAIPTELKESAGTLLTMRFHGAMADYQRVKAPRPQDLHHYLALLCQRIVHHGGTLYHADGTGLLAAFGVDHAIDRDAVQAISAARDLRAIAATWQAPPPTAVITSGALATMMPTESNTSQSLPSAPFLFGQPLTDSQPMLARATPGQILVNLLAQERAKDRFHFRQWSDSAISAIYELISSPVDMPVERLTLDFTISVGREREQARLADAWREVMDQHGQVIGISGEAGIGKSHLVNTFKRTIVSANMPDNVPDNARWQQVICTTDVQHSSYGLLARLLRAFLELPDYATNDQIETVLRFCFPDQPTIGVPSALAVSEPDRALLADLLGSQPQQLRLQEQAVYQHQLYALLRRLLGQQLRHGPLVLVVEDAHWSDPASMEVLALLATNVGDAPVLLLLLYRSEWTPPWHGKEYFQNINLKQLELRSRQSLFSSILHAVQLPEELVALLERSSGNPLFLTEILVSLVQKGLLVAQDDGPSPRWQLHGNLEPNELPDTVQRIIEMRLDQLDAQARGVLEIAAVVGASFTPAMLLWGSNLSENVLFADLKTLVDQDFLRHNWENDHYEFRHALIRDGVYTKIAVAHRQRWHKQIAERLEQREQHQREVVAELAHHYYLSLLDSHQPDAPLLNREADRAVVEKALAYLLHSGQDALDRYAGREAVTLFQRGSLVAELLPHDAVRQAKIYMGLGNGYRLRNDFEQAVHAFEEAHAALHRQPLTLETRPQAANLARLLARQNMRWAKYEVAEAWIETGLERVRAFTDAACQSATAMLHIHAGSVCYNRGDYAKAIEYCQTGLKLAELFDNEEAQAEGTFILGAILQSSGQNDKSLESYNRALELRKKQQNLYQIHRVEMNIGVAYFGKSDWSVARSYYERAIQFWRGIDELDLLALTSLNLGVAELYLGNWPQAEQNFNNALHIWKEMQNQRWLALCHSNLGTLLIEQEAWTRAKEHLELCLALVQTHAIQDYLPDVWTGLAQVALGESQVEKSLKLAQQARQLAAEQGLRLYQALALRTEGRVYVAMTKFELAEECLTQSLAILVGLGDEYEVARTKVQLATVLEVRRDITQAMNVCTEALQVFAKLGAVVDQKRTQLLIEYLSSKTHLIS